MRRGILQPCALAVLRRYPFLSGGANFAQRDVFNRLVPARSESIAPLRDGGQLYVTTHEFIGRAIFLTGDYDPKITWLCQQVLRPGDTMVDVGANLGVVSAYAARLVGGSGAVHAFEVQPNLALLAAQSMRLNSYTHALVHPFGLSDADMDVPLYGSIVSPATVSLHSSAPGDETVGIGRVRDATNVFASLRLGPIRMLKLDIEGHEETFLRGAMAYLRENTPDVIAFESHGVESFYSRPTVRMLTSLGYILFQHPKALLRMRLVPIWDDATRKGFDFVAVQPRFGLIPALT